MKKNLLQNDIVTIIKYKLITLYYNNIFVKGTTLQKSTEVAITPQGIMIVTMTQKKPPIGGLPKHIQKAYNSNSITTTESPVSGSYSAGGMSTGSLSLGLDGSGAGPRSIS